MKSLLIVGAVFGEVAARVQGGSDWEVIHPCTGPADLAAILAAQRDGSIERLDICDHGGPGFLTLGRSVLFQSDRDPESPLTNAALALGLRDKLTRAAQVRLLGCETGGALRRRREGRLLLLKLAQLLNHGTNPRTHRVVFGTITGVQASDFDEHGFLHTSALTMLFSSYAALDHEAPTYDDRLGHVAALHGDAPIAQPSTAPKVRPARVTAQELLRRLVQQLSRIRKRAPSADQGREPLVSVHPA